MRHCRFAALRRFVPHAVRCSRMPFRAFSARRFAPRTLLTCKNKAYAKFPKPLPAIANPVAVALVDLSNQLCTTVMLGMANMLAPDPTKRALQDACDQRSEEWREEAFMTLETVAEEALDVNTP